MSTTNAKSCSQDSDCSPGFCINKTCTHVCLTDQHNCDTPPGGVCLMGTLDNPGELFNPNQTVDHDTTFAGLNADGHDSGGDNAAHGAISGIYADPGYICYCEPGYECTAGCTPPYTNHTCTSTTTAHAATTINPPSTTANPTSHSTAVVTAAHSTTDITTPSTIATDSTTAPTTTMDSSRAYSLLSQAAIEKVIQGWQSCSPNGIKLSPVGPVSLPSSFTNPFKGPIKTKATQLLPLSTVKVEFSGGTQGHTNFMVWELESASVQSTNIAFTNEHEFSSLNEQGWFFYLYYSFTSPVHFDASTSTSTGTSISISSPSQVSVNAYIVISMMKPAEKLQLYTLGKFLSSGAIHSGEPYDWLGTTYLAFAYISATAPTGVMQTPTNSFGDQLWTPFLKTENKMVMLGSLSEVIASNPTTWATMYATGLKTHSGLSNSPTPFVMDITCAPSTIANPTEPATTTTAAKTDAKTASTTVPTASLQVAHAGKRLADQNKKVIDSTSQYQCPKNSHHNVQAWPITSFQDCKCDFEYNVHSGSSMCVPHDWTTIDSQSPDWSDPSSASARSAASSHYGVLGQAHDSIMDWHTKGSVLGTVVRSDNLYTLSKALFNTAISTKLNDKTNMFTIFAPTDAAFAKVFGEDASKILEDTNILRGLLQNHFAPSKIESPNLKQRQSITMASGNYFSVSVSDGSMRIGSANIIGEERIAVNGVVHVIDSVLMTHADAHRIGALLGANQLPATVSQPVQREGFRLHTSVNKINGSYTKHHEYIGVEEAYIKDGGHYVFFKDRTLVAIATTSAFKSTYNSGGRRIWRVVYIENTGATNVMDSGQLRYLQEGLDSYELTTSVTITTL